MNDQTTTLSDLSKLQRLRNWQSHEFWARLFARPLCILLLYPIADLRWVTPNRITHLSNLFLAGGVGCILLDHWIWAAILLQLHLVFDNMDGTLARYRNCGTHLGSYYDKISDYLGIWAMFGSLGWVAFRASPENPHLILVGCGIVIAEMLGGYSKWVVTSIKVRHNTGQSTPSGSSKHFPPPTRTPIQWIGWFGSSVSRIVLFEEVDYFFWVGLALIMGRLDWMLYLVCATRVIGLLGTLVVRGIELHRLDDR